MNSIKKICIPWSIFCHATVVTQINFGRTLKLFFSRKCKKLISSRLPNIRSDRKPEVGVPKLETETGCRFISAPLFAISLFFLILLSVLPLLIIGCKVLVVVSIEQKFHFWHHKVREKLHSPCQVLLGYNWCS